MTSRMRRGGLRGQGPTLLVASITGTFGVLLLQLTGVLALVVHTEPGTARSVHTVPLLLGIAAWLFIIIALYVSSIVTSNTVATVVAGRRREIALLRLIGSSGARERSRMAREGLTAGAIGGVIGILLGTALADAAASAAAATGLAPAVHYDFLAVKILFPAICVTLTTWLAAWAGARRVLSVRPIEALGNAAELDLGELRLRGRRHRNALVLVIVGMVLLASGVIGGLFTPLAVLIGIIGGILSFTGIVLGAEAVIPPVLRLIGGIFGRGPVAQLAARSALRNPERSSRMVIGITIGVTLVMTFSVTMTSYQDILNRATAADPNRYDGTQSVVAITIAIFSILIGISALIAAVGLVNALSLSVAQRTRELGLMRALGFDRRQLRVMLLAEAAALTIAATIVGLVLGFLYGWAGAQAMFGGIDGSPGLVLPGLPWGTVLVIVVAAAVLTLVAAVAPSRRATAVSPVVALAVE